MATLRSPNTYPGHRHDPERDGAARFNPKYAHDESPAQEGLFGLWAPVPLPRGGKTVAYYPRSTVLAMEKSAPPPVSTRYAPETIRRLDDRARVEGSSRSALIQRYVAEGLEMDEHPGIVFRDGPAGRRAGLVGGPDVWEVVAVVHSFDDVERAAAWLDQPASAVETALRYYEARRVEVDDWIRRNEEAAEAAERVARARQAAS
jgi:hypothetical protein